MWSQLINNVYLHPYLCINKCFKKIKFLNTDYINLDILLLIALSFYMDRKVQAVFPHLLRDSLK